MVRVPRAPSGRGAGLPPMDARHGSERSEPGSSGPSGAVFDSVSGDGHSIDSARESSEKTAQPQHLKEPWRTIPSLLIPRPHR